MRALSLSTVDSYIVFDLTQWSVAQLQKIIKEGCFTIEIKWKKTIISIPSRKDSKL